ncbi:MAG: DnaJ C-terminal domain-containing protein [Gammaproteobacteria bacterium]
MEFKDYYATMGVPRTASADEIKRSYRKLARKYHPDVSKEPNAEEKFKEVQEAYEVLKDPKKRASYDQLGTQWQAGQEFRPPPNWQGQYYEEGSPFEEGGFGGFSDFFENIFGGGRSGRHAGVRQRHHEFNQRGSDQHAKINVSLEEAYHGATKEIQLQVPEIDAQGRAHNKSRVLKINIPKGVISGQQLRLAQQGLPGIGKGAPGDLYLEIELLPHRLFTLQGRDVYVTLPVTPWEAALGAKITVPTLGGPVDMKISPNSQAGQKLRLKERGIPGRPHGDQYALLQIQTPPAHTDTQRALYEKMAQEMPFNPRERM